MFVLGGCHTAFLEYCAQVAVAILIYITVSVNELQKHIYRILPTAYNSSYEDWHLHQLEEKKTDIFALQLQLRL